MIELKRPEIAAKYAATVDQDLSIQAKGYAGKLSMINESGAEHLIRSKHPALRRKSPLEVQQSLVDQLRAQYEAIADRESPEANQKLEELLAAEDALQQLQPNQ